MKITGTRVILFFILVLFLPCISGCGDEITYGYPLPVTYSHHTEGLSGLESISWKYLLINVMFGFFLVLLAFVFTQQAWQKKEMRVAAAVLVIYTALHAVLTWTGYLGAGEMAWAIGQALHLPLPVFIELFEDKDMHPLFRTDMDLPIRLSFTVSAAGYALIAYYFTRWRSKDKGNQDGGKKNPEGLLRTITRMTDLS